LVLAWIAAPGLVEIGTATGAAPIAEHLAQSLTADIRFADKPQSVALRAVEGATPDRPTAEAATIDGPSSASTPEAVVTAALTDATETLPPTTQPPKTMPEQEAATSIATPQPDVSNQAAESTSVPDRCAVDATCIDRYLWALYQQTPKEDAVRIQEQRNVTVKKKGKLVTVKKTFTKVADEDFAWKDLKAAERVGMPIAEYVIDGMDRDFKLKLFQMLRGAEEAGLSPGITSAFRDNYRQSIASGLKAADNRSYHGGSLHGGYGHGLAADIVSVNGATRAQRLASSEILWKWVDAHGKEFGIGRPYLGRDPPHVAPIDGQEYADHHPGMKARRLASAAKTQSKLALRDDRGAAKRARTARSSI
jgi:hypothetical protein